MISTYITLAYMLDPSFDDWAVWRAAHAVLNATNNAGLTTKQIEAQIRLNFPNEEWKITTLSSNLSWSDDFKQRKRGKEWYLTGTTRGVEKCGAKRARKAAEANGAGAALTLTLPHPINVASAHNDHPPPPALPPPTSQKSSRTGVGGASNLVPSSTRRWTRSQARKRAAGYHPYEQPPAANAGPAMALDHPSSSSHDSQLNRASRPEIKNAASPPPPIFAEPKPMVSGLQGLLTSVLEKPPRNIPAVYGAPPTRPSAPPPTQASFVPWTQRSSYPEGINPSALELAYPGNLEVGAVDSQAVAGSSRANQQHPLRQGLPTHVRENPPRDIPTVDDAYPIRPSTPPPTHPSFVPWTQRYLEGINPSALDFAYPGNLEVGAGPSGVNQQHPLEDNLNNAGTIGMPLSESHGHEDFNTLGYGTTITHATLPAAHHTMALPGDSAVTTTTVPPDFWAYNAPVSHNPVHYAPPTLWARSQSYPEPEIAPAGFPLDMEFL
ncbi:hypothetical protein FS837_012392 [Tulasnella sp. UAMH 9824]|nr:hypothetical protein FS837_012392 [Tulasnella sp. UAMH 9824]